MQPFLRRLAGSDLAFAHSLSCGTGWNQTRRDWERFLELGPDDCFLAEVEGSAAGTTTTTIYRKELAWIGMVLVDPSFRRRGIGTLLLETALRHLRDRMKIPCIRLDATPEGRPLYEKLGFVAEWDLQRWAKNEAKPTDFGTPCSKEAERSALPPVALVLDHTVFGADRSILLETLRVSSDGFRLLPDGSFGFRRSGQRAQYLGPITVTSPESGLALAEGLIADCPPESPLLWDLPILNPIATQLATRLGFSPVRHLTRMRLGSDGPIQDPSRIFGIAEPALG